ncbi:Protein of unknown function DUF374 [hydrothermal vent metagenome]|uniref:DUF374 domain-containing protein n=1 Tax=hydrothermal vent metagenome TaxID=652676 RepID=A0A1W1EJX2_9ZZZZ
MKLIWWSSRKKYHYIDEPIKENSILVGWHGELFILPSIYKNLEISGEKFGVISHHHDGDVISKALSFFGIKSIRGSSSKGARGVIINSIKEIKNKNSVFFTPDGPRGPRYTISDGALSLAIKFRLPIVIIGYKPSRYWQFNSWDKFILPKPFGELDIYYQVLYVTDMNIDEARELLYQKMMQYAIS